MNVYRDPSDPELLNLIRSGNHSAFKALYDRHWHSCYVHACKMLRDEDSAKDIVQDVFISLWQKSSEIEIRSNLPSFLYSSVRNRVLNLIRDNKVRKDYLDLFGLYLDANRNNVVDKITEKELNRNLDQAIKFLPKKMREIFEMSRKQHLSHKEIAFRMEISELTVKKQISNALALIRLTLSKLAGLILAVILSLLNES